jgi:hypothetical protein
MGVGSSRVEYKFSETFPIVGFQDDVPQGKYTLVYTTSGVNVTKIVNRGEAEIRDGIEALFVIEHFCSPYHCFAKMVIYL